MRLIKDATAQKLRGGFYTPPEIADFVSRWALSGYKNASILEPSCGDGAFLASIKRNKLKFSNLTGIELFEEEASKAERIGLANTKILNQDFYKFYDNNDKFDIVIGNPPYIRYQYFNKTQTDQVQKIFSDAGLTYSKLANAWVSFVLASSLKLKDKGRIALVLPAEILQVSYAQQLREFLAKTFNQINIISFKKLVFPTIQQEVVLLLCERDGSGTHTIDHIELVDSSELVNLNMSLLSQDRKTIDFKSNKWTFYFLSQIEIDLLERIQADQDVRRLGEYAKVEVGITTGANSFFTVTQATVKEYDLYKYAKPLVGRSVQVASPNFTFQDWQSNVENGARAYILEFPSRESGDLSEGALRYLALGEQLEINKGYKNKIRPEWQIIPSMRKTPALFVRRNNIYPKFVINHASAYTTDTMHRVTPHNKINLNALTASYYNSLSFAFSEVSGRSHGGGVLELMPNEVENILLPYDIRNERLLTMIDESIRNRKPIQELLSQTDKIILGDNLGFTDEEIHILNNIWRKLLNRRLNRN